MDEGGSFVIIFDFDKTILDCDSDNWVIDQLGFNDLFDELLPTMPWNSLMDRMMNEFHAKGKTMKDIAGVLKRAPLHPRIIHAIKTSHALGCELRIVSDANEFFIETILEHHGIRGCFSEINTNPSFVDEEGRLRISPYHDFSKVAHGCSLCPPNMCKGLILQRIQGSITKDGGTEKRMIYLGDGSGDYCPGLKLDEKDFMMPRKNFPVWDLICQDPRLIKARTCEWTNGEDLERVLFQIIDAVSPKEKETQKHDGSLSSAENCKIQTMISVSSGGASTPEVLPTALEVRQH